MFDDGERKQIKKLLSARFTIEELEQLVRAAGEDFDSVVQRNANKTDAIFDILEHAERDGWPMELLSALVESFEDRLQSPTKESEIAKVREIEKGIKERWGRGTALADPFKSCFVRGGWPFVNRPQISNAFTRLAKPGGFRIAVIDGPTGSGKTYSKELPLFVAEMQEQKTFRVYYRDVSEGNYAITAEELVQSILRNWNLDVPLPPKLSQSTSYASDLSEWLAAKTPKGEMWWLIIDGLAKIPLDTGLLNFLMALARHIADSQYALRLVLLDLGKKNPLPPPAEPMTTKVKIDEISISDLMEHYFKLLHTALAAQNPFDEKLIAAKAEWALAQALAQTDKDQTDTDLTDKGKRFDKLKETLLQVTKELGFC